MTTISDPPRRLTSFARCGGCASKLAASDLSRILGGLPEQHDDRVLLDYRTSDDAGIFRLDETRALVQTVDFFTPIVDDPFVFGQIAAANAVSDVYAMGGTPLTALAIAAFSKEAPPELLSRIAEGGLAMLGEAHVALLGGHTVQDTEIKFGYAVTGEIDPRHVWTNAGARPGDVLILTKAIGTGAITTALRGDHAPAAAIEAAIASMTRLNGAAAGALRTLPAGTVRACTDVTGFSLMGHGSEMAAASGCTLEIAPARVPLLDGAIDLALDHVPGGGRANLAHFGPGVRVETDVPPALLTLLYDPQTSGGLLISVDPAAASSVEAALAAAGAGHAVIGRVRAPSAARIVLR